MTNQAIFDKVVTHLRKQGRKAQRMAKPFGMQPVMACSYRDDDGLKCAVGCLIPDKFYTVDMEGATVRDLRVLIEKEVAPLQMSPKFATMFNALASVGIVPEQYGLLERLQAVHDSNQPTRWEMLWDRVARDYCLTIPPRA